MAGELWGRNQRGRNQSGRVNKGHFFQPGHLLFARFTGVGGAAAASGIMPAQADWPDDPLASYSVGVWCVGIAR